MNIGDELTIEKTVEAAHFASVWGSGGLDVFATPSMIAFMEGACLQLAQKHLPEGQTTVGTRVCVDHVKPSGLNQMLRIHAKLISIEGRQLCFDVEACNEGGLIGKGTHTRAIIDIERFMKKLSHKNDG